jgi:transposase-like protein
MTSATAGTIFQDSHLPLRIWFRAIWWFTNQKTGVSALGMQRTLGMGSYRTAWTCLHKLRRAMVRPNRELLTGTVEADETLIGGRRKSPAGGGTLGAKAVVLIAVERRESGAGRVRFKRIPFVTGERMAQFVRQSVAPGSTVVTDGHPAYAGVLKPHGYIHESESGPNVLPRLHRVAALLKRWLLGVYQGRASWEHLDHYLDEFAFRFNRRLSPNRGMLFYRLVQQAVAVEPAPYANLAKGHKTRRLKA